jgi:Protein of unknown function (DUF2971)
MTAPDHPAIEDCLFHYTSTLGLLGILEKQCIYATDSAFLNDSSEMFYGGRALEQHLNNLIGHHELQNYPAGSDERRRLGLRHEARDWLATFNNADYDLAGPAWTVFDGATYISCFTEKPDQLSQWRGYGGLGYSIGFTKESLNRLTIEGTGTLAGDVLKVGYGERGLQELCRETAIYFNSVPLAPITTSALGDTLDYILPRLASVKHPAFEEELEWRITVSEYKRPARPLYFREGNRLVPYIKLKFDPSDIAFVYIGPGGDIQDTRALRALLGALRYDPARVWIQPSPAPYRR